MNAIIKWCMYIHTFVSFVDEWRSSKTADSEKPHISVSSLSPNTLYKFRVVSVNAVGSSEESYEVVATTGEERPSGAPRNVTLNTKSCTSINITWQVCIIYQYSLLSAVYMRLCNVYCLFLYFLLPTGYKGFLINDYNPLSWVLT